MTPLALLLSLIIMSIGASGVIFPDKVLACVLRLESLTWLWIIGGLRIIFGIALFLAAPTSYAPEILRILGIIIFLAGFVTPFIGVKRFHKMLNWWSERDATFRQAWAAAPFIIGLLLVAALTK